MCIFRLRPFLVGCRFIFEPIAEDRLTGAEVSEFRGEHFVAPVEIDFAGN